MIFILSFLSVQLQAQQSFTKAMQTYYLNYLPEKVYVHSDKSIYAAGETVWLAVYLTDGYSHRPGTPSDVVRLELRDGTGKAVIEQKLYVPDGYATSELGLPASLPAGDYQLIAYTNYQRNSGEETLFGKTLRLLPGLWAAANTREELATRTVINRPEQKPPPTKLRFFPEGGDCIEDMPCRMAFVAENEPGVPVKVNAEVIDSNGTVVSKIQSNESGMGSFVFIPKAGQQYQANLLGDGAFFELPAALEKGFRLSVQKRRDAVRLSLQTNLPQGLAGTYVGVHLRGNVFLDHSVVTNNKKAFIDLPLTGLTPGVYVCTLFDPNGQPVAERLFFHAPKEGQNVLSIRPDKQNYGVRDSVRLKLNIPVPNIEVDSLAASQVSLSVLPLPSTAGPQGDDIITWLLLNSDLDRSIPYSPELLFATDSVARDQKVDEFLLTRGWRRFRWEMASSNPDGFQPKFPNEQGLYLRGRMGKFNYPNTPRQGSVLFSHLNSGYFEEIETDEKGHFTFGPFLQYDTLDVLLKGYYYRNKARKTRKGKRLKSSHYTHLELFDYVGPKLPFSPAINEKEKITVPEEDYQGLSQDYLSIARNYDSLSILLDVVDVTAKRISPAEQERYERSIMYGGRPDSRIIIDSLPGGNIPLTIFDMLRGVSGVRIIGGLGNEQILIRGAGVPAFFFDGMPMDIESIRLVDIHNIEFVDVIRGARSGIMGGNGGGNGAVLVYSRTGSSQTQGPLNSPRAKKVRLYGFHKARQFAVFDPTTPENNGRPDLRTTLHWNGAIKIGKDGTALETFNTSDQKACLWSSAKGCG